MQCPVLISAMLLPGAFLAFIDIGKRLVLSSYARARRCPVLTYRMVLQRGRVLDPARYAPLSAYALATRCPVLTYRMALSVYALPMRCPVLTYRMALSAYELAMWCPVLTQRAGPSQNRWARG
eukprot:3940643-Rhodomonas_salina.6